MKEKKTPKALADEVMASVKKTEEFLELLRNVGSFYYRKKIHLSDVELAKQIDEAIESQLVATRDYYLLYSFIEERGLKDKFVAYHKVVMAEVQKTLLGEIPHDNG